MVTPMRSCCGAGVCVSLLDRGALKRMRLVGNYGKLIMVLLLVILIRDRREALYALSTFCCASLLLASSWMLFDHLPVPWATSAWH
jgi:hypothetical protein